MNKNTKKENIISDVANGTPIAAAARRYNTPYQTAYNWVYTARKTTKARTASTNNTSSTTLLALAAASTSAANAEIAKRERLYNYVGRLVLQQNGISF